MCSWEGHHCLASSCCQPAYGRAWGASQGPVATALVGIPSFLPLVCPDLIPCPSSEDQPAEHLSGHISTCVLKIQKAYECSGIFGGIFVAKSQTPVSQVSLVLLRPRATWVSAYGCERSSVFLDDRTCLHVCVPARTYVESAGRRRSATPWQPHSSFFLSL